MSEFGPVTYQAQHTCLQARHSPGVSPPVQAELLPIQLPLNTHFLII